MAPNLDLEIDLLMAKLDTIQTDVGVPKEGKSKDGKDGGGKAGPARTGDRFLDLKAVMIGKLREIRTVMTEQQEAKSGGAANPKQTIEQDTKVRKLLRELNEDFQELETLYNNEAKKRRSKFSPEELRTREEVVIALQQEIEQVRAAQRGGYIQGYNIKPAISSMEDSELFRPASGGSGGGGGPQRQQEQITADQQMQLQQLKERDDQINEGVEKISRGVDVLQEIALQQQEEVKKQNVMLEGLATHMDNVHDHVNNVNQKMKTTLDEVARSGDKFCVDALCILLLLGLIGVLYQLTSSR